MIMFRPSCLGWASTKPSSSTSPARRCSNPEPEFGPGLLTPPEHNRDLDLVALLEEPLNVTLLGAVVVRVDLRPELDLLDDRLRLILARFPGLERGLVLELAVVHQLADRRTRRGRDFHQVEVGFLGQPERVIQRDNPDLLAVGTDEPHLGIRDPIVDTGFGADVTSLSRYPAVGASGGGLPLAHGAVCCRRKRRRPHTEKAPRGRCAPRGYDNSHAVPRALR